MKQTNHAGFFFNSILQQHLQSYKFVYHQLLFLFLKEVILVYLKLMYKCIYNNTRRHFCFICILSGICSSITKLNLKDTHTCKQSQHGKPGSSWMSIVISMKISSVWSLAIKYHVQFVFLSQFLCGYPGDLMTSSLLSDKVTVL